MFHVSLFLHKCCCSQYTPVVGRWGRDKIRIGHCISVSMRVQNVISMIHRALQQSIERDKERTVNIMNIIVSDDQKWISSSPFLSASKKNSGSFRLSLSLLLSFSSSSHLLAFCISVVLLSSVDSVLLSCHCLDVNNTGIFCRSLTKNWRIPWNYHHVGMNKANFHTVFITLGMKMQLIKDFHYEQTKSEDPAWKNTQAVGLVCDCGFFWALCGLVLACCQGQQTAGAKPFLWGVSSDIRRAFLLLIHTLRVAASLDLQIAVPDCSSHGPGHNARQGCVGAKWSLEREARRARTNLTSMKHTANSPSNSLAPRGSSQMWKLPRQQQWRRIWTLVPLSSLRIQTSLHIEVCVRAVVSVEKRVIHESFPAELLAGCCRRNLQERKPWTRREWRLPTVLSFSSGEPSDGGCFAPQRGTVEGGDSGFEGCQRHSMKAKMGAISMLSTFMEKNIALHAELASETERTKEESEAEYQKLTWHTVVPSKKPNNDVQECRFEERGRFDGRQKLCRRVLVCVSLLLPLPPPRFSVSVVSFRVHSRFGVFEAAAQEFVLLACQCVSESSTPSQFLLFNLREWESL